MGLSVTKERVSVVGYTCHIYENNHSQTDEKTAVTYSKCKEDHDRYHYNWHLSWSFSFIVLLATIPLHPESMQLTEGRFHIYEQTK